MFAFAYGNAYAFHSGGVAECEGCHSMHNSFEGSANVTGMPQYASGPYLLKAQDQSGACLNCHEGPTLSGYHVSTSGVNEFDSTVPANMTPGGDFAWLKKTMTGSVRSALTTWEGERHGHNIIAVDFGYGQDGKLATSPGGNYPASALACSSCHDPHGRYRRFADGSVASTGLPIFGSGSYGADGTTAGGRATQGGPAYPIAGQSAAGAYRILGGVGYQPKSLTGSYAFTAKPPSAVAPSQYNGASTTIQGSFDNVAYGSGMAEWCGNCHGAMHRDSYTSGMKSLVHPAGNGAALTAPIAANYNAYISSGIMTGTGANYSALAPVEYYATVGVGPGNAEFTTLRTLRTARSAADTNNNVTCLSCHRAHASAFESMARYSIGNEFMTVADATGAAIYDSVSTENKINFGYNAAQQQQAYNGRPATLFGPYARNYCNKCHAKD
jgi:hypothetical protein